MDLLKLPAAELKRKLVNGDDFNLIMKFFFDHFVDESAFLDASYPIEVPKTLATAVSRALAGLQQKSVVLSEWRIAEVSLLKIVHGSITMGKDSAVIVWAPDIEVGLLGIPSSQFGKTLYVRITVSNPTKARVN